MKRRFNCVRCVYLFFHPQGDHVLGLSFMGGGFSDECVLDSRVRLLLLCKGKVIGDQGGYVLEFSQRSCSGQTRTRVA